jgi:hypothetical protein
MSLAALFFIVGGVLHLISAFWNPPNVSLSQLAWACLLFGLAAGVYGKVI